jgi:hypothetical protein
MAISTLRGQRTEVDNDKNGQKYEDEHITQNIRTKSDLQASSDSNNEIKIIADQPAEVDALDFERYSKNLASIIRGTTPPQFAVGIFGKWGTGKTTLMRMIEQEFDNERDKEKILTVWFDAWRYEKEKYLAVIPFLRQVRIKLENDVAKNRKTSRWNVLKEGLAKTFNAFTESTELSVAPPGSPVSSTISFEKFVSSLKSEGSTHIDGEHIQFHEHSTDYLKSALIKLEQENPGSRIVVFVDDLDRCTPENALEVLESIKAFFDINGIIYVVGMDSESIDHIVKQKYGEGSKIKGMDYLQKIVQLPFQIPVWKAEDISGSIEKIISKGLEHSELVKEFKEENKKSLIVSAIEPNPRQVKRFVNNIILAKAVFGKDVDIDKLIAVQALNFNRDWNRFLELIISDKTREDFFKDYYIPMKEQGIIINSKDALDRFIKEKSAANNPLPREIIDIFQELIKTENVTLTSFLDVGADKILLTIKTMEEYRRALEATKLKEEENQLTGRQVPTKELFLELLRTGRVKQFNDMRIGRGIYPNLSGANLPKANLSFANLSFANLSFANLSGANLSGADLRSSIIVGVIYYGLKCVDADFKDTIIDHENLSTLLNNGSAKNVPPAVKNKKELRDKLRNHRAQLSTDVIDKILSRSSLKD